MTEFRIEVAMQFVDGIFSTTQEFCETAVSRMLASPSTHTFTCSCGRKRDLRYLYNVTRARTRGVIVPVCTICKPEGAYRLVSTLRHALRVFREMKEESRRTSFQGDVVEIPRLRRVLSVGTLRAANS